MKMSDRSVKLWDSLFLFQDFRQNSQMFKQSTLEGCKNNWPNIFSLFRVTIKEGTFSSLSFT